MRKTPEIPQDVFFEQSKPQARKTVKRQAGKQSTTQKVQVTIYLSDPVAKDLERARFELLTTRNLRVSKSAIAEYAIGKAVADLEGLVEGLGGGG